MIKKFTFILILFLGSINVHCQCLSLNELISLCNIDFEKRDNILSNRGFKMGNNSDVDLKLFGVCWQNKKENNLIFIKDVDGIFIKLNYRLLGNKLHYNKLKSQVLLKGFKKDGENVSQFGTLSLFYSNKYYGLILSKWKSFESYDEDYFSFDILNLDEYQNELRNKSEY